MVNKYRPNCDDAMHLGVKAGMAHSICECTCEWQVKLCDYLRYRIALVMSHTQYKVLYKCPVYFTLYKVDVQLLNNSTDNELASFSTATTSSAFSALTDG